MEPGTDYVLLLKKKVRALLAERSQPLGATAPAIHDGPAATAHARFDCTGDQPQSGAGVPKTRSRLSSRSSQDIEAFPPPAAILGEQLRTQRHHVINPSLARDEPHEIIFQRRLSPRPPQPQKTIRSTLANSGNSGKRKKETDAVVAQTYAQGAAHILASFCFQSS